MGLSAATAYHRDLNRRFAFFPLCYHFLNKASANKELRMSVAAPERPRTFAPPLPATDGGRILVHHVPWTTYVTFTETLLDNPGLRMTFDRGSWELIANSNLHEWITTRLGR